MRQDICGVILSLRAWGGTITIWSGDDRDMDQKQRVTEGILNVFPIELDKLRYMPHKISISHNRRAQRRQRLGREGPTGLDLETRREEGECFRRIQDVDSLVQPYCFARQKWVEITVEGRKFFVLQPVRDEDDEGKHYQLPLELALPQPAAVVVEQKPQQDVRPEEPQAQEQPAETPNKTKKQLKNKLRRLKKRQQGTSEPEPVAPAPAMPPSGTQAYSLCPQNLRPATLLFFFIALVLVLLLCGTSVAW